MIIDLTLVGMSAVVLADPAAAVAAFGASMGMVPWQWAVIAAVGASGFRWRRAEK